MVSQTIFLTKEERVVLTLVGEKFADESLRDFVERLSRDAQYVSDHWGVDLDMLPRKLQDLTQMFMALGLLRLVDIGARPRLMHSEYALHFVVQDLWEYLHQ